MTEPNRATWREFVEWVAQERSTFMGRYNLRAAAPLVRSKEAALAALVASGYSEPNAADAVLTYWRSVLVEDGIEPPADPPSVAEVLKSVAKDIDRRADQCTTARDAVERDSRIDGGRSTEDRVVCAGLDGEAYGLLAAVGVIRAKAKEFT